MLKTLRYLEEAVKISTSQAAVPNLPGRQEPRPDGPLSEVDLGPKAALFPPLHLGLSSCLLCCLPPLPPEDP